MKALVNPTNLLVKFGAIVCPSFTRSCCFSSLHTRFGSLLSYMLLLTKLILDTVYSLSLYIKRLQSKSLYSTSLQQQDSWYQDKPSLRSHWRLLPLNSAVKTFKDSITPHHRHLGSWKCGNTRLLKVKNALVLAGAIESIDAALADDYNVYVFCSSRRDSDIIAEKFSDYAPVCYNAYTKGDARCDAVLKNQRLSEGNRLFIGTSAAGVGISILDPKAKTIIVAGLNHGSRGTSMLVQKAVRDRGRRGVELHHTDYNSSSSHTPKRNRRGLALS